MRRSNRSTGQLGAITGPSRISLAASHNGCSDQPQVDHNTPSSKQVAQDPQLNNNPKRGPASGRSDDLILAATWLYERGEDRFWSKVVKLNGVNACWVWNSQTDERGYGFFWLEVCKRPLRAARLSYTLAIGPIPDGLCVCHHCDNPICVRPDHLFVGTVGDNMRDMVRKGRHPEQISRQTHCKRGHEYTEANTIHKKDGTRSCKACAALLYALRRSTSQLELAPV